MTQHVYGIRRAYIVPLGIDTLLLLSLLVISLLQRGDATEKWIFLLFALPTAYLFLESLIRRIVVTDGSLFVRTLWKKKTVFWGEITHVGCLNLRRKVYLLLTTTKGIIILSNAYEEFVLLTEEIIERVGVERVEEEVRLQGGRSGAGIGNVVLAWVAAAFMAGVILMKVYPFTM